jgi:hypothetical protein
MASLPNLKSIEGALNDFVDKLTAGNEAALVEMRRKREMPIQLDPTGDPYERLTEFLEAAMTYAQRGEWPLVQEMLTNANEALSYIVPIGAPFRHIWTTTPADSFDLWVCARCGKHSNDPVPNAKEVCNDSASSG